MAKQKKEKQKSTFWKDFKAFISRGNIIDLAVGLVVGAAFTAIVNSLVNDIIKPLIALLVGGNLSELAVILRPEEVNEAGEVIVEAITLNYGNLIMAILTFLIDAFVIFTAVRIVRNVQRRIREESEKLKLKLTQKENGETVETEAVVEEQAPAPRRDQGSAPREQGGICRRPCGICREAGRKEVKNIVLPHGQRAGERGIFAENFLINCP